MFSSSLTFVITKTWLFLNFSKVENGAMVITLNISQQGAKCPN